MENPESSTDQQTTSSQASQDADFSQLNGPLDVIGMMYNAYGDQIKRSIGRAILLSIKGSLIWFAVSFLPIPYWRKRDVHRRLVRGEKINLIEVVFGRLSIVRLVLMGLFFAVLVFVFLNLRAM